MKKILLIDNYDSFTYNLRHMLLTLGCDVDVFRNDKISFEQVDSYNKILLSPGPGIPSEAGILLPLIKRFASKKSILGVCLGEQAIGEAFGAKLVNLSTVYHGVSSVIKVTKEDPIFNGLDKEFAAGRYHSWAISSENFPDSLEVTATDAEEGLIMAIRHKDYDVRGIQFHPESLLTPCGETIIKNWLSI